MILILRINFIINLLILPKRFQVLRTPQGLTKRMINIWKEIILIPNCWDVYIQRQGLWGAFGGFEQMGQGGKGLWGGGKGAEGLLEFLALLGWKILCLVDVLGWPTCPFWDILVFYLEVVVEQCLFCLFFVFACHFVMEKFFNGICFASITNIIWGLIQRQIANPSDLLTKSNILFLRTFDFLEKLINFAEAIFLRIELRYVFHNVEKWS